MPYILNVELLVFGYIREISSNIYYFNTKTKTLTALIIPIDIQKLIIGIGFENEILQHLGIVCCGPFEAGKTILCARLLHKLKGFTHAESKQFNSLKNNGQIHDCVQLLNKEKGCYDGKRTINYSFREFFTNNYHYTLIDAPGNRCYINNFICAGTAADVGLVVVPATLGGFELSICKGNHRKRVLQGELRHKCWLLWILGVEQLIVCVNKMDDETVQYSQDRFNEIKVECCKFLTKTGYKTKKIAFIPISALNGDNIFDVSSNMQWYTGFNVRIKKQTISGHSLLDALDNVIRPRKVKKKSILDRPLRMSVLRLYTVPNVKNRIIGGHIEQGQISINQKVKFVPSGCSGTVETMKIHHKSIKTAYSGFHIGLNIAFNDKHLPKKGDVMVVDDKKYDLTTLKAATLITALALIQDHPGRLFRSSKVKIKGWHGIVREEYQGGVTPCLYVRNARVPCQLIQIRWKMGRSTSNCKIEYPAYVEEGDQCEVILRPKKPIVVLPFAECKPFGRAIFMDHNQLLMLAKVIKVEYDELFVDKLL